MLRAPLLLTACLLAACADDKDPTTLPESMSGLTVATQGSAGSNPSNATTQNPSDPDTDGMTSLVTTAPDTDPGPTSEGTGGPTGEGPTTGGGDASVECALFPPPNECDDCTCYTCFEEYLDCWADAACKAMDECFRYTGCVQDECYAACPAEIEAYGGDPYDGFRYVNLAGCRTGTCALFECGGFDPF